MNTTTEQTLDKCDLNWTVKRQPLFIGEVANTFTSDGVITGPTNNPDAQQLRSHYANVRSDTNEVIGVVGHGYSILQNEELCAIAEAVESETGNEVVGGGYFRGGKDVYIQLKGHHFTLPGADEVEGYRLYYNNHAGEKPNYWLNTTNRIYCQNTLNAAIGNRSQESITIRHTGSMLERIEDAITTLKQSDSLAKEFRAVCTELANKTSFDLPTYFDNVYKANFGKIPNPYAEEEKAKRTRFENMKSNWYNNFDADPHPSSLWKALNGVTEWVDHERTVRGESKDNTLRQYSNLFGTAADFKRKALNVAMEMV